MTEQRIERIWEFWKLAVLNKDGSLNLASIKRELADYYDLLNKCHMCERRKDKGNKQ